MRIELGWIVKDTISGFEGVVTCRSEWLHGCVRVGVESQDLKDGKPVEPVYFDEDRVKVLVRGPQSAWMNGGEQPGSSAPGPVQAPAATGGPDREHGISETSRKSYFGR